MADSENRVSSAGDAIPMKKSGVTTYLAIGGAVVAVGVVALVSSGKSDAEAEQKAAAAIKAATAKKSTSSMTAEEQREHMKMTARAFERAQETAATKAAEAEQQVRRGHIGVADRPDPQVDSLEAGGSVQIHPPGSVVADAMDNQYKVLRRVLILGRSNVFDLEIGSELK